MVLLGLCFNGTVEREVYEGMTKNELLLAGLFHHSFFVRDAIHAFFPMTF